MGAWLARAVLAALVCGAAAACGARTPLDVEDPSLRPDQPDGGGAVPRDADPPPRDAPGSTAPRDGATPAPAPDGGTAELPDGAIPLPPDVRPRQIVAAGWRHTCAVVDSAVWCWGFDSYGQAGARGIVDRVLEPVRVEVAEAAVEVTAGLLHSCALLALGGVQCWGANDLGQLGDGTRDTRLRPVLLRSLPTAVRIAAAGEHTCALLLGGEVWCWGHNGFGQLGDGSRVTRAHPAPVHGLTDAVDLVAGRRHTCAVRRGGALHCWGAGAQGQLGLRGDVEDHAEPVAVPGYENVRSVAAGAYHTCALAQADSVDCWGSIVRIGGYLARADGFELRPVVGFYDIHRVSGGDLGTTCAIFGGDREIRCVTPTAGECGPTGGLTCTNVVDVGGVAHATSVSVGYEHGCATVEGGGIACWGGNEFGQRGDGTTTVEDGWTATRVVGL